MTRFRSMVVGAALVALAACSHDQPGIEVRTVQVPTPVACLARDQIPAEPPQVGSQLNGNAAHDLALVAESALLLRAWGQEMHAALSACAD